MTDTEMVSRRRFLGSLVVVGGASAAGGAGTMASFSDAESSSENTVQAGTLDLELNGNDQTVTFLDVSGVKPGDDGFQSIQLGNTGSITGTIEIIVEDVRDSENGIVNNENSVDDTPNQGELQNYVEVRAEINGTEIRDWTGLDQLQSTPLPYTYPTGETIVPGSQRQFTLEWRFNDPGDKSVNEAQSDSVEMDLTFRLVQT
ncbi:TasA family protein [Halorhabdus amylolytica]|uniref:TasA family protein n=1 Tax=Halorhabdus amylolytica TaxID=2559573 RepID=UPI0010AA06EF|nr:TasA family protein [Halorhabdus amylolytica]